MNLQNLIVCIAWLLGTSANAQIIAPDSVCTNEIFTVGLEGFQSEEICLIADHQSLFKDFDVEVVGALPDNSFPLFSQQVVSGQNHYLFTSLSTNGDLVRSDFGDRFSNTPVSTTFTLDDVPNGPEGLQIIFDGNEWWGFIIGGNTDFSGPEFFVRLYFGTSITNTPTVENLGNIGNLKFPHDLFIVKENDRWLGFTTNRKTSTITRFDFGNSLANMPVGSNLGNIGQLDHPTGFYPIQEDGLWHLFVINTIGNSISRLDFGNSLLNDPTGVKLDGNVLLDRPRDMIIMQFCDVYYGLVANRANNGEILIIELGTSIESNQYSVIDTDMEGLNYPHSLTSLVITKDGYTFFVVDVDRSQLYRINIGDITCSTSGNDLDIVYSEAGTYTLQMVTDIEWESQQRFCKDIVVMPSPFIDLGADTVLCVGESLLLESQFPQTLWQGAYEGDSFEATAEGIVHAMIVDDLCETSDSIRVTFEECMSCFYVPNVFAPNQGGENALFSAFIGCEQEIVDYEIAIYNRWGEEVFTSIELLEPWDGRFNNRLCAAGVYVWRLSYSYVRNDEVVQSISSGDVTLIR